jgi:hypothetical protein
LATQQTRANARLSAAFGRDRPQRNTATRSQVEAAPVPGADASAHDEGAAREEPSRVCRATLGPGSESVGCSECSAPGDCASGRAQETGRGVAQRFRQSVVATHGHAAPHRRSSLGGQTRKDCEEGPWEVGRTAPSCCPPSPAGHITTAGGNREAWLDIGPRTRSASRGRRAPPDGSAALRD